MQEYYCSRHENNHKGSNFCHDCTLMFALERRLIIINMGKVYYEFVEEERRLLKEIARLKKENARGIPI